MNIQDPATSSLPASECYQFGLFTLDVAGRKLVREGQDVTVPSRAFDALVHLVRHRDRIIDKDELIKTIWPDTFVTDDSLIHCISVLRRALQDEVEHPKLIVTLPRRGYRFVGENVQPTTATPLEPTTPPVASPQTISTHHLLPWMRTGIVTAVLTIVASVLVVTKLTVRGPSVDPPIRPVLLAQVPSAGTTIGPGGILSPRGQRLAFIALDQTTGTSRIWLRSLDSMDAQPINGTDDASKPFWSPDGEHIGFFAGGKLKTIAVSGGSPKTIAVLPVSPTGGSWSVGDLIVFGDYRAGLSAVKSEGGPVTLVTALEAVQDVSLAWPHFLPDGRHLLYTVRSWNANRAGIWIRAIAGGEAPRRLLPVDSPGVYASSGHLLFVSNATLMAVPFDLGRLRIQGDPISLFRNVSSPGDDVFSVAGKLMSFRGGNKSEQLAWFTRDGHRLGAVEGTTPLYNPVISPDGTQLVGTGSRLTDGGLWLVDLKGGGASTRLAAEGVGALWSPDGQHVAFTTRGGLSIKSSSTAGRAEEALLLTGSDRMALQDWSPDGRYIVYTRMNSQTKLDLWLLPVSDPHRTTALIRSPANERNARISPDGRWIAYTSDETGRSEVYLQEFPNLGSKRAVSVAGGAQPSWRHDGKELFYLSPTRTLMAVDVLLDRTISIGPPRPLFRAPVSGDPSEARNHYAPAADGQRFLINVAEDSADRNTITVVVNWTAALQTEKTTTTRGGGKISGG